MPQYELGFILLLLFILYKTVRNINLSFLLRFINFNFWQQRNRKELRNKWEPKKTENELTVLTRMWIFILQLISSIMSLQTHVKCNERWRDKWNFSFQARKTTDIFWFSLIFIVWKQWTVWTSREIASHYALRKYDFRFVLFHLFLLSYLS